MAKLTGVKTIDMVNGEITKVEYNGEHYVKVDGEVGVGDIVLSNGVLDSACGNFYVTIRGKDGRRAIKDDVGDYRDALDTFIVFRKQSAPTSASDNLTDRVASLEQRVDSLEGKAQETYRLVTDRKPKVGDFVKFSEEFAEDDIDLTAGNYYEVTNVESDGDVVFYDDLDDERFKDPNKEGVEVYEKVIATQPETITHNGEIYTLVDRKAQPGDVVEYETGFITEVTGYDRDGNLLAYNKIGTKTWAVYGHYQPVKVYAPVAKQVEPLKEENTALRVGDYAKVISVCGEEYNMEIGDIVKLTEAWDDDFFYYEVLRNRKKSGMFATRLVKATDEEVAQAKAEAAQQAEFAKWAAIGRKPNEYKEGDVVVVTGRRRGGKYYGEIAEDYSGGRVSFRQFGFQGLASEYLDTVELITPVEARFDRK